MSHRHSVSFTAAHILAKHRPSGFSSKATNEFPGALERLSWVRFLNRELLDMRAYPQTLHRAQDLIVRVPCRVCETPRVAHAERRSVLLCTLRGHTLSESHGGVISITSAARYCSDAHSWRNILCEAKHSSFRFCCNCAPIQLHVRCCAAWHAVWRRQTHSGRCS
jgi:ribosomal protein S27E